MNIFIDSISTTSYICIFDNNRKIIKDMYTQVKWNESSKLIPDINSFLEINNIEYKNIENIVVVNGPGSFTWVRTSVLIANTINFVIKKDMTALSYFDLFENYPIIKSSSRRDHFLQKLNTSDIEIIENNQLEQYFNENNITTIYGENSYDFENVDILEKIDYNRIIQELELKKYTKIEPLYIKKPNIC